MQKFYVKVNENEKPYLEAVSQTAQDGYTEVQVMDSEIVGLVKFTTKCFLKDNGAVQVPGELPLDEQQKQLADMQSQLNQLTADRDNLKKQLDTANKQSQAQQAIISILTAKLNQLGQNVQSVLAQNGGNK
jgi:predicted butyrate kinase (DUF1464 family)